MKVTPAKANGFLIIYLLLATKDMIVYLPSVIVHVSIKYVIFKSVDFLAFVNVSEAAVMDCLGP